MASCKFSEFIWFSSPIPSPSHHLIQHELCGHYLSLQSLSWLTGKQRTCEVSLWTVLLTWRTLIPSSGCSLAGMVWFHNEGSRCSVSSVWDILHRLRLRVSGFMKGFFSAPRHSLHSVASLAFTNPTPLLIEPHGVGFQFVVRLLLYCWAMMGNLIAMLCHVSPDPPGDALWPLCGLVGSRGATVWDAVRTRPIWSWKWRWPLWIHPQWRDCLCVLAQHRGSEYTQSCESTSTSTLYSIFCIHSKFGAWAVKKYHDRWGWMNLSSCFSLCLFGRHSPFPDSLCWTSSILYNYRKCLWSFF